MWAGPGDSPLPCEQQQHKDVLDSHFCLNILSQSLLGYWQYCQSILLIRLGARNSSRSVNYKFTIFPEDF